MLPEQRVLGFVDASRKVVRAPLVGMEFLHQRPMGAGDVFGLGAGLKAKDLVGLLLRHWPARPVPGRWALRRADALREMLAARPESPGVVSAEAIEPALPAQRRR